MCIWHSQPRHFRICRTCQAYHRIRLYTWAGAHVVETSDPKSRISTQTSDLRPQDHLTKGLSRRHQYSRQYYCRSGGRAHPIRPGWIAIFSPNVLALVLGERANIQGLRPGGLLVLHINKNIVKNIRIKKARYYSRLRTPHSESRSRWLVQGGGWLTRNLLCVGGFDVQMIVPIDGTIDELIDQPYLPRYSTYHVVSTWYSLQYRYICTDPC